MPAGKNVGEEKKGQGENRRRAKQDRAASSGELLVCARVWRQMILGGLGPVDSV